MFNMMFTALFTAPANLATNHEEAVRCIAARHLAAYGGGVAALMARARALPRAGWLGHWHQGAIKVRVAS
jgi:hypothetical protein